MRYTNPRLLTYFTYFCGDCANNMTNADQSNATLFATSQRAQSLSNQVSVNISGVTHYPTVKSR